MFFDPSVDHVNFVVEFVQGESLIKLSLPLVAFVLKCCILVLNPIDGN